MGALLKALETDGSNQHIYSEAFLNYFESHLEFLKTPDAVTTIPLNEANAYRALGDVYLLQSMLGVPKHHWYINMRLNGMKHPFELDEELKMFHLIKSNVFDNLYSTYVSRQKRI